MLLREATRQDGSWTLVPGIAPEFGTGSPLTFQILIGAGSLFFQVKVSVP